jgi:phospholipid transport system substrate-binding protein
MLATADFKNWIRTMTRRLIAALLAFFLVAPLGGVRAAEPMDGARKFIESLADEAMHSLTGASTPRPQRIEGFRKLFESNFDVELIGQWILGRYWRPASEEERKEYLKLFEDLMVVSYVDRFARYTGDKLKITGAEKTGEKDVTVRSQIDNPGSSQPVRVDWRVVPQGQSYKIVDVIVEGTSMSTTLRSEFGSIINREGGKVAGLNRALKEKVDALR